MAQALTTPHPAHQTQAPNPKFSEHPIFIYDRKFIFLNLLALLGFFFICALHVLLAIFHFLIFDILIPLLGRYFPFFSPIEDGDHDNGSDNLIGTDAEADPETSVDSAGFEFDWRGRRMEYIDVYLTNREDEDDDDDGSVGVRSIDLDPVYTDSSETPATPAVPETPETKRCLYCFDTIPDDAIKVCGVCKGSSCRPCLYNAFKFASSHERNMPLRCCGKSIPLALGRLVLAPMEIVEYKRKFDEWKTADRSYCPVPTCSAFLSPNVYPEIADAQNYSHFMGLTPASRKTHCFKCFTDFCIRCVQLAHPERHCHRDDDMTPELADEMDRSNSKRCPWCRAGVHKTDGCSHMTCYCGAQWCWHCLRSMADCSGSRCRQSKEDEQFPGYDDDGDGDAYDAYGFSDEEDGNGDDNLEEIIAYDPANESVDEDSDDEGGVAMSNNSSYDGNDSGYMLDIVATCPTPESPIQDPALALAATQAPHFDVDRWEMQMEREDGEVLNDDNGHLEGRPTRLVCHHRFESVEEIDADTTLLYECENCWEQIFPAPTGTGTGRLLRKIGHSWHTDELRENTEVIHDSLRDMTMFRCDKCFALRCKDCRRKDLKDGSTERF